jgi:GH24 family phage-related lysozyme (muramidase)/predicted small lipoprotein YifL
MKSRCLAALAVALLAALTGCGHAPPPKSMTPTVTYVAPESARTPEGARPTAPPKTFSLTPHAMHISTRGLHLIEGFEGWSSCPYWDAYGHVWTRGYGETEGIGRNSPCISRARGEAKLESLVESRYEWALRALGRPLNQNQWDADCSFVWNLGAGIFTGTTIGAEMRTGNFRAAASSMLQYVHAGGVVLVGLVTRRRAEVRLFLTPVKPAGPTRAQLHRQLNYDYRYRAHLRTALLEQGCRVVKPSAHCRGVLKSGTRVNRRILKFHARHIY